MIQKIDFYSNDFENYSRSIFSSRAPKEDGLKNSNNAFGMSENNANISLYSNENFPSVLSSIDSTISSISSQNNQRPAGKATKTKPAQKPQINKNMPRGHEKKNHSQAEQQNLNEELQVSIENILSETNGDNFETDANERVEIEKAENWPVYAFCFKFIDTLIDNISIIVIRSNKSSTNQLETSVLPIICDTINNLIRILYDTKSEWCNLNLNEVLMNLFKKLNFNFKYCLNKLNTCGNFVDNNLPVLNRLVYMYLVITFYKLINLMNSSNEVSKWVSIFSSPNREFRILLPKN